MMSKPIHVSDATFEKEVLRSNKPVLVDFWAPWCGPCRMLGPELDKLAAEANGEFIIAKVNVDENPTLASRYHVSGIPTMKLFDHGKVIQTTVGLRSKDQLKHMILSAV